MRVAFKRMAFLEGKRYRVDSRGVEYNGPEELLPRDAEILDKDNTKKGEGLYENWPSPSGKGIPAVQPMDPTVDQKPPADDQTLDQKRVPPPIVANVPSPPLTLEEIEGMKKRAEEQGLPFVPTPEAQAILMQDKHQTPQQKLAKGKEPEPFDREHRAAVAADKASAPRPPAAAPAKPK